MPQYVRFINQDYRPFDFHHQNAKRIVPPGGDAIVPWDLAVTLFGHPRLPNSAPRYERTKAYERIRARHNFSSGLQQEDEWEAIRPHVDVYDLEDNTQIVMLIDDPEGVRQPDSVPTASPAATDVSVLQQQIAALTQQVTTLINRQMSNQAEPAAGNASSPTAVQDSPGIFGIVTEPTTPSAPGTAPATPSPDNPQAVPVAAAGDDSPPAGQRRAPAPRPNPKP